MDFIVIAFADAGPLSESSYFCYIIEIVIVEVKKGSNFHRLSGLSHRSRRPAKSTPAAVILAACEAVEETFIIKEVMSNVLNIENQRNGLSSLKRLVGILIIQT